MGNDKEDHALVADEEAPIEFALMANTSTKSKVFDNSLCSKDCKKNNDSLNSKITDPTDKLFDAKNMIYHYKLALAQVKSRLVEYKEREVKYIEKIKTLEYYHESKKECIETLKKELETLKKEKEVVDGKLAGLLTAIKDLDNLIESQRPSPTVESSSEEDQNKNPSVSENVASPITPKPFVKFVKASDSQSKSKTDEKETPKKPPIKYAKQYRKPNKKPNVRGNQRNLNNLKSHQLGPDFVMKKKACFNCGDFNHLAYKCRKRVKRGTTRSQNNTSKSSLHRPVVHRPHGSSMRPMRSNMNCACSNRTYFNKPVYSYKNRPFQRKSAMRSQYKAPWVPTANRNFRPINRKFSTDSRNFPTINRKFSIASRKFPTGSLKNPTADMGMKGKSLKPSAC
nr:ubiquitin hydrolase [Tanacetum cinerariifolium]